MNRIRTWFSDRTIFAPFGRYEGSRKADEPFNQVLVGREHQRARLLNLLFTTGRTGAILVTGQRGSGKTSFVNYCLNEYCQNVHRRWGVTNVGRAFFWDRLGNLLLVGFLPILGLLLCAELIEASLRSGSVRLVEWFLLFPLVLATLSPLLLAARSVDLLWKSHQLGKLGDSEPESKATPGQESPLRAFDRLSQVAFSPVFLCHVGLLLLLITAYPFGALPALSAAQLIFLFAGCHLIGELCCVNKATTSKRLSHGRLQRLLLEDLDQIRKISPLTLPFLFICLLPATPLNSKAAREALQSSYSLHAVLFYLASAALCFGLASLIQARDTQRAYRCRCRPGLQEADAPEHIPIWLSWLICIGSFVLLATSAFHSSLLPVAPWMIGTLASTLAYLLYRSLKDRKKSRPKGEPCAELEWNPPFRLLLLLKATALTLLSAQLFQPVIANILRKSTFLLEVHPPNLLIDLVRSCTPELSLLSSVLPGADSPVSPRLFGQSEADLFWVSIGVILFLVVGALEFSWIVRAGVAFAEDYTLHNPTGLVRPPGDLDRASSPPNGVDHSNSAQDSAKTKGSSSASDQSVKPGDSQAGPSSGQDEAEARKNLPPSTALAARSWLKQGVDSVARFCSRPSKDEEGQKEKVLENSSTPNSPSEVDPRIREQDPELRTRTHGLYRSLLEDTFFSSIYGAWLPVLIIRVNLGFDDLDYRRVVEAMMSGLRSTYAENFLHWSKPLVAAKKLLLSSLLVLLALTSGNFFLSVEDGPAPSLAKRYLQARRYCADLALASPPGKTDVSTANWLVCRIGGEALLQTLHWRPFNSEDNAPKRGPVAVDSSESTGILSLLFSTAEHPLLQLRLYHLLILLLSWLLFRSISRHLPISFHRRIYDRMSELYDNLSASVREEYPPEISSPFSLATAFFRMKVKQKSAGPLDPRTVELQFLQALEEIHTRSARLPLASRHRISLPTPELIFVFDELDKIGIGRPAPHLEGRGAMADTPGNPPARSRERAEKLHLLFGDLKNLISSARARFIFLGARNLHDESLADYADRNPLLSNIFDEDIYLPSLLSDTTFYVRSQVRDPWSGSTGEGRTHPKGVACRSSLADRYLTPPGIDAFLAQCHWRAKELYRLSSRKANRSWFAPWRESRAPLAYARSSHVWTDTPPEGNHYLRFYYQTDGAPFSDGTAAPIRRELLQFLACRSLGNVKRLRTLVETLLWPVEHVAGASCQLQTSCDHVLALTDVVRYRVQLISTVYRELLPVLEDKIYDDDDKLVTGILYLADFLLKFHRRGFTWGNLGRLDELVHIHRPPDLRLVIEQVVVAWSDRFLHAIRNGMYDYRFESAFARELAYISHRSERELAAFNFTLDESQALKKVFQDRLKGDNHSYHMDFVSGLGELQEFDEEYELARLQYRKAIELLDQRFRRGVPSSEEREATYEGFKESSPSGRESLRIRVTWGVSRVRLMLQVAMTHEQSREFEQAQLEYRNARTLATAIISGIDTSSRDGWTHVSTVKHRNILFQPLFAEAWVSEKIASGVDTSTSTLELGLEDLRSRLPEFVHRRNLNFEMLPDRKHPIRHGNFALTLAELHDKAGDLYFFKGKLGHSRDFNPKETGLIGRPEGYLFKAFEHYAEAAHYLRRYVGYRTRSSKNKLNFFAPENRWETITSREAPDFLLRTLAGVFADLAEVGIARISVRALFSQLDAYKKPAPPLSPAVERRFFSSAIESLESWLETPPGEECPGEGKLSGMEIVFPELSDKEGHDLFESWLGVYRARSAAQPFTGAEYRLESSGDVTDLGRLCWSLVCLEFSCHSLERAGHFEAAAREKLRIASTVASLIWFQHLHNTLGSAKPHTKRRIPPTILSLVRIGVDCLEDASRLFTTGRPWSWSGGQRSRLTPAEQVPPEYLSVVSWMGNNISYLRKRRDSDVLFVEQQRLLKMVGGIWPQYLASAGCAELLTCKHTPSSGKGTTQKVSDRPDSPDRLSDLFCSILCENIANNAFPLRERLIGILCLLYHAAMTETGRAPASDRDSTPDVQKFLWRETGDHIVEFLKLKKLYSGSLHLPPCLSGFALAALGLRLEKPENADGKASVELSGLSTTSILRAAAHDLQLSQEMYTMRRGYYDAISGLYYIYDDFNDRTIHHNHALQMASSDLCSMILRRLSEQVRSPSETL